jgi:dTMP kinase
VIISFEGGEGVGKTTHVSHLCSYLSTKELPWLSFREPGGSLISEEIRALFLKEGLDAMTELLLVLASRKQNIMDLIAPGLAQGSIVIVDRFIDSTIVYQGIAGGLGRDTVKNLMEQSGTWLEPDLTFVMDMDPEAALKRITPGDKFENKDIHYHQSLRKAFLDIATDKRHRIINADRDTTEVAREIDAIVEEFLSHA